MIANVFKQALREPLVHFLAAGSALFLVMGQFGGEDSLDRSITINEAEVTRLASQWEQTWSRPPSAQELDSVIRDYIKEEVYFREAMRLGLDADDLGVGADGGRVAPVGRGRPGASGLAHEVIEVRAVLRVAQ